MHKLLFFHEECKNEIHFANISCSTDLKIFIQGMTESRELPKLLLGWKKKKKFMQVQVTRRQVTS